MTMISAGQLTTLLLTSTINNIGVTNPNIVPWFVESQQLVRKYIKGNSLGVMQAQAYNSRRPS